MTYSVGRYTGEGRNRWAVFCATNGTWYFPEKYGIHAARRMAERMNKEA